MRKSSTTAKPSVARQRGRETLALTAAEVHTWLEKNGTPAQVASMARYGITASRAYGVPVGTMLTLARQLGKNHALSLELWKSEWYESRMMAAMVGEPAQVTRKQMNAWAAQFDSWAICDTVCWHLFDRTPHAWGAAHDWVRSPREFVKRAGYALMASLVLHDKGASDDKFREVLPLIEEGAFDERNFVKKAVNWALRTIGKKNAALHASAVEVATRLAARADAPSRWVGKDALRELTSASVQKRLAGRRR